MLCCLAYRRHCSAARAFFFVYWSTACAFSLKKIGKGGVRKIVAFTVHARSSGSIFTQNELNGFLWIKKEIGLKLLLRAGKRGTGRCILYYIFTNSHWRNGFWLLRWTIIWPQDLSVVILLALSLQRFKNNLVSVITSNEYSFLVTTIPNVIICDSRFIVYLMEFLYFDTYESTRWLTMKVFFINLQNNKNAWRVYLLQKMHALHVIFSVHSAN